MSLRSLPAAGREERLKQSLRMNININKYRLLRFARNDDKRNSQQI